MTRQKAMILSGRLHATAYWSWQSRGKCRRRYDRRNRSTQHHERAVPHETAGGAVTPSLLLAASGAGLLGDLLLPNRAMRPCWGWDVRPKEGDKSFQGEQ